MLRSHPTRIQIRCCEHYSIWRSQASVDILVLMEVFLNDPRATGILICPQHT
jgi:hypothetical protein